MEWVKAYRAEKKIKAIGTFLDKTLREYCDIFPTRRFNSEFDFVYVSQSLDRLETESGGIFPFDSWYLEQTDLLWMAAPELLHLVDLYTNASSNLPEEVKRKYRASIKFYERQYPAITKLLKASNFDITQLSPDANWQQVFDRHPESMAWAIKMRNEF